MITRIVAASLALLFATTAAASVRSPAGPYDDVDYGDMPHATFGIELAPSNGLMGSQYDDTRYPTADAKPAPSANEQRVAERQHCTCCA